MKSENLSLKKSNPKILILGRGYVGGFLYDHLSKNYDISIISSSEINYHEDRYLRYYILNNNIELIINCSGFTGKPNVD